MAEGAADESVSRESVYVKLGGSGDAAERLGKLEAEYSREFGRLYEEHKEKEREAEERLQSFLITY